MSHPILVEGLHYILEVFDSYGILQKRLTLRAMVKVRCLNLRSMSLDDTTTSPTVTAYGLRRFLRVPQSVTCVCLWRGLQSAINDEFILYLASHQKLRKLIMPYTLTENCVTSLGALKCPFQSLQHLDCYASNEAFSALIPLLPNLYALAMLLDNRLDHSLRFLMQ